MSMNEFLINFKHTIDSQPAINRNILLTVIAFVVIYSLRLLLLRLIIKSQTERHIKYKMRKLTIYISTIFFILLTGHIWLRGVANIMTYMGLLSAGLAVALKQPIENIVGWWFILWKRPFEVGDRIQIGDQCGDVIDQGLLMFSLMEIRNWVDSDQSTGRLIHIPNGKLFQHTVANYNRGFGYIWNEIPVLITFESNWRKADDLLSMIITKHSSSAVEKAEEAMNKASEKYLIFYSKLSPIVYTNVKDSGILLTMRYLCEPKMRRTTEHNIWRHILSEFENHEDIELAYPTQRYYNRAEEISID